MKFWTTICCFMLSLSLLAQRTEPNEAGTLEYLEEIILKKSTVLPIMLPTGFPVDSLISYSKKYIGTPYRYGGRTEKGFDCSGFVMHVYNQFGIQLPPSSRTQVNIGSPVPIDSVQKGDLLFFKGRNLKNATIGHVAIVVDIEPETRDVLMIHSTTRGGLRLDWLFKEDYYRRRYVTSRRLSVERQ